jgi:hypothetical protein
MYPKMLWSEPIKNLLNAFNIWKVKQVRRKTINGYIAEMDVLGREEASGKRREY